MMSSTSELKETTQASLILESFPETDNEKRGFVMAEKFIGALKHFEGRHLSNPKRGEPWPDIECKENDTEIGIEIIQMMNGSHLSYRLLRKRYAKKICELIGDVQGRLFGLRIILNDGYQNPPYPKLREKAGQLLVYFIADRLRANVKSFEGLPVGHDIKYDWQGGPGIPTVGAYIYRYSPKESNERAFVNFSSVFPIHDEVQQALLRMTIEKKVKKRYTTYPKGQLWLLIYEAGFFSGREPPPDSALIARQILQEYKHPFDEVWHLIPIAQQKRGFIQKIWP